LSDRRVGLADAGAGSGPTRLKNVLVLDFDLPAENGVIADLRESGRLVLEKGSGPEYLRLAVGLAPTP